MMYCTIDAPEVSQREAIPQNIGARLVFAGREALHRVTRVSGARPRLVPVLTCA